MLFEKLLAFDPGFNNLKGAVRGTLAVTLSFLALTFLAKLFHQPATLAFLGVLIALMGSMVVNDLTRKDQMLTMAIVPIPASIALALSIFLEPWPVPRLAGFLIVTFFAVAIRRFGIRWAGVGMTTFMAYFSPFFFPIHADTIPWVVIAVYVSTSMAFLARFYIVRDEPESQIKLYLESFRLQAQGILKDVAEGFRILAEVDPPKRALSADKIRERLRKKFEKLNEASLSLEMYLASNASKGSADSLQLSVFEQELSLRRFLDAVRVLQPYAEVSSERLIKISAAVASALGKHHLKVETGGPLESELQALVDAFHAPRIEERVEDLTIAPAPQRPSSQAFNGTAMHASTRQAIQATLATAIASLIGASVSPTRWYWASIAAFVVFVGASRGETLVRASLRVLGTIAGLILGFFLAYLTSGNVGIEWVFIVGCIFFGLFGARMAFGFWSSLMFTLMVAILFDVMGTFSKEILILRLEETLVGALIGAAVSAYVLPSSTTEIIRNALAKLSRTVSAAFDEFPEDSMNAFARRAMIKRLRQLDHDLLALRLAAAPVIGRGSVLRRGGVPGAVHDATVLTHYLRHLLMGKSTLAGMTDAEFKAYRIRISLEFKKFADDLESRERLVPRMRVVSERTSLVNAKEPSHWMERIEQLLASLRRRQL